MLNRAVGVLGQFNKDGICSTSESGRIIERPPFVPLTVADSRLPTQAEADFGDSVDPATFDQILEMDDDEDEREFSKGIVYGFFEQAQTTFQKMDNAV